MPERRFAVRSLALTLALGAAGSLSAAEPVRITNFPEVQRVEVQRFPEIQRVRLDAHAPVTQLHDWPGLEVSPVSPATAADDLERFHDVGRLDATGFASLRASVAGRLSGSLGPEPRLELVLLPDTRFIQDAWKSDGVLLHALRLDFDLALHEKGLFEAAAEPIALRFPAYRVFLRNESPQSLDLDLYLQLGE